MEKIIKQRLLVVKADGNLEVIAVISQVMSSWGNGKFLLFMHLVDKVGSGSMLVFLT